MLYEEGTLFLKEKTTQGFDNSGGGRKFVCKEKKKRGQYAPGSLWGRRQDYILCRRELV